MRPIVFVVISGERGEGGSIRGVRTDFRDAEIIALSQTPHFGSWQCDECHPDPLALQDGDTVKSWESGCDFVKIEKWTVK